MSCHHSWPLLLHGAFLWLFPSISDMFHTILFANLIFCMRSYCRMSFLKFLDRGLGCPCCRRPSCGLLSETYLSVSSYMSTASKPVQGRPAPARLFLKALLASDPPVLEVAKVEQFIKDKARLLDNIQFFPRFLHFLLCIDFLILVDVTWFFPPGWFFASNTISSTQFSHISPFLYILDE